MGLFSRREVIMDLSQAVGFVETKGTDQEKARLRWLLYAAEPGPAVLGPLAALQNADGGFPLNMVQSNPTAVDSTLTALWWMEELGLLESAIAGRAYAFLLAVQQQDGGWDEDAALARYDLPPWVQVGQLPTRLYLTAYAAYWLGLRGCAGQAALRALGFLSRHQDETGQFLGYLHTTWIATSAFLLAGPLYAGVAEKGLESLLRRPAAEWEDSQLAWALSCLGSAGLPREHPFVVQGLAALGERQRPDGSWASEDGAEYAVSATIQVLKVLKHYAQTFSS
jgi:squalene cyclase